MVSQDKRRAQTRQKILQAAGELFLEKGFEKTTLAAILARADVVKGTFYQHFSSKVDLLVILGRQSGAERVRGLIDEVEQGRSPLDALQGYYLVMAQWFEAHPQLALDIIISAIQQHDPDSNTPEYVAHDFSKLMLRLAQQRNEVRQDIDVLSQATVIGGAVTLAVIDWQKDPKAGVLQERVRSCLTLFLQGVQTNEIQ